MKEDSVFADKDYKWYAHRYQIVWKVLIGFSLFLLLIGFALTQTDGGVSVAIALVGGGIALVVGISGLVHTARMSQRVVIYKPKKGFSFYRKTATFRIRRYSRFETVTLITLLLIALLCLTTGHWATLLEFLVLLVPLAYHLHRMKNRIRFHEPVDDASYFELEELGIVSDADIIKTLYKDFSSWSDVKENDKLLIVTQDAFICVRFSDKENASRFELPLSQFDRLGILRIGKYFEGYLLTLGFDGKFLRIKLNGNSYQDSPEEFIAFFLKEMDARMLHQPIAAEKRPVSSTETKKSRITVVPKASGQTASHFHPAPSICIRNLDLGENGIQEVGTEQNHTTNRVLDL